MNNFRYYQNIEKFYNTYLNVNFHKILSNDSSYIINSKQY